MKRMLLFAVGLLLLGGVWLLGRGARTEDEQTGKKQSCSSKCGNKAPVAPGTGFFITDSFSGIL
ncbi:MAG TPA: hypothetical protein PKE63_04510 [Lacibacter sp.]|nr:hypothetical protein [Lacibacter sp.]HMO88135.1 hypothetical protein [Lacibacter sp.]HMP86514.1 hypothetical protein [Lacibacter sp.]